MKNKRKKIASGIMTCLVVLLAVVLAGFVVENEMLDIFTTTSPVPSTTLPVTTEPTEPPVPTVERTVTIGSAGDVLIHIPVYQNARQSDGTYDFSHLFTYSEGEINDCDYFVANLETTLGGTDGRKYSGFPRFNSPDSIVDALKGAGIDCLLTANNHSYDTNGGGVKRTLEIIDKAKLDRTGSRKSEDEKQYLVKNVGGIKFGFIC